MDRQSVPDWRSANAYAVLARCDRHAFAWEWLRRLPDYRDAWRAAQRGRNQRADAALFGLHRFEPPDLPVPSARPIWTAEADPSVLAASATAPGRDDEPFDAARLEALSTYHRGSEGAENWLFSDGRRQIRLDVAAGTLRAGPMRLAYDIAGLARAQPHAMTLMRLIALARSGRLSPTLFPPERRAPRWALILRAHDAITAGASHREIAAHLFGLGELPRWRINAPSYRRRVQRLAALAHTAASVDPLCWLDGRFP